MKIFHAYFGIELVDTDPVAEQFLVTCEILNLTIAHWCKLFVADSIVS